MEFNNGNERRKLNKKVGTAACAVPTGGNE